MLYQIACVIQIDDVYILFAVFTNDNFQRFQVARRPTGIGRLIEVTVVD